MLELAILGLLKEKAMHGYELKQQLTQKLGHFWQVSYGSLYPALRDLRERGAIEPVYDSEETSRRKNVYRITTRGEREFLELIEDPASTAWEEDKFPLRFAFFRFVKPETRLRLLERRRVYLEEKLADLRASLDADPAGIDTYTRSLMRHGVEATAADIAWLDELIGAERRLVQTPDDRSGSQRERVRRRTPPEPARTAIARGRQARRTPGPVASSKEPR
jgi:DNA-binding PadR family transcriptional regulator